MTILSSAEREIATREWSDKRRWRKTGILSLLLASTNMRLRVLYSVCVCQLQTIIITIDARASHLTPFVRWLVWSSLTFQLSKYQFTQQLFWFSIVNISHLPFTQSLSRTTIPNIYIWTCLFLFSQFSFPFVLYQMTCIQHSDIHRIKTKPDLNRTSILQQWKKEGTRRKQGKSQPRTYVKLYAQSVTLAVCFCARSYHELHIETKAQETIQEISCQAQFFVLIFSICFGA